MQNIFLEHSAFKQAAKNLRTQISKDGFNIELSHSASLNLLARVLGYKDYNTYNVLVKQDEVLQNVQPLNNTTIALLKFLEVHGTPKNMQNTIESWLNRTNSFFPNIENSLYENLVETEAPIMDELDFTQRTLEIIFYDYFFPFYLANNNANTIEKDLDFNSYEISKNSLISLSEDLIACDYYESFIDSLEKHIREMNPSVKSIRNDLEKFVAFHDSLSKFKLQKDSKNILYQDIVKNTYSGKMSISDLKEEHQTLLQDIDISHTIILKNRNKTLSYPVFSLFNKFVNIYPLSSYFLTE